VEISQHAGRNGAERHRGPSVRIVARRSRNRIVLVLVLVVILNGISFEHEDEDEDEDETIAWPVTIWTDANGVQLCATPSLRESL